MERTKGGYIILDLTMIQISVIAETSISNAEVLSQLKSLSDYALRPDRQLKPIYLRAIDSNGVEVVSLCELERNASLMSLRIKALIMDMVLNISVVFDIDADTEEVLIDSAKYEVIKDEQTALFIHRVPILHTNGNGYIISARSDKYETYGDIESDDTILKIRYGQAGGSRVGVYFYGSGTNVILTYLDSSNVFTDLTLGARTDTISSYTVTKI